jgi:NADH-quinone oxidoreductase subunit N
LITLKYNNFNDTLNPEVYFLHSIFFFSITTLLATSNIFVFYILIELVGFSALVYSAVIRRCITGIEASIKYYIINTLSSILLLISLSLLWYHTGSFDFESISNFTEYINNTDNSTNPNLVIILYLSFYFILFSFLLKLYVAPLHN